MSDVVVFLFFTFAALSCVSIALIAVMVPLAAHHRSVVKKAGNEGSVAGIFQTLTVSDLLAAPELEQPMRDELQKRARVWLQAQVRSLTEDEAMGSKVASGQAQETTHSDIQQNIDASAHARSYDIEQQQPEGRQNSEDQIFGSEAAPGRDQDKGVPGTEGPEN